MTDKATIEYWKERLWAEENSSDSDSGELRYENGVYLYHIDNFIKQINDNNEKIAHSKWHWWYQIKLAERVIRLFKLKRSIYDSKKATAYWRKYYMNKTCKIKANRIDEMGRDNVIGYLSARMTEAEDKDAYLRVIRDLKGVR